jgi:hypothetical protein
MLLSSEILPPLRNANDAGPLEETPGVSRFGRSRHSGAGQRQAAAHTIGRGFEPDPSPSATLNVERHPSARSWRSPRLMLHVVTEQRLVVLAGVRAAPIGAMAQHHRRLIP